MSTKFTVCGSVMVKLINVLFECKEDLLRSTSIECVKNKEMVSEYLAKMEYIPHIRTVITMEPTAGLQTSICVCKKQD